MSRVVHQPKPKGSYTNAAFCQQSEFFDARRQSPVGAQTAHLLDTSVRSGCVEEEQQFYEEMVVDDRGAVREKKFVVVHQQQGVQGRYDYVNASVRSSCRSRMASPPKVLYHEEVDASTGRLHRYATIPTDDEEQEDVAERQFALVPVAEVRNNSRYAVITQEDIAAARGATRVASPARVQQPAKVQPNPAATEKLREFLATPKKRVAAAAVSPIRPRAQQKLNYAVVAPICSRPVRAVYDETTCADKPPSDAAQKTIAVAAFMMILCGAVTAGLSLYMISYLGRNYYLDFGTLSGAICFLLGLLGFRSRHVYWLPNRNYISGYFVLSVFSLLACCGLLVLLVAQPRPGTLLADMTSGAVCGISGLSLGLAAVGLLASYCCNVPPPDNRVQHCAPGFNV